MTRLEFSDTDKDFVELVYELVNFSYEFSLRCYEKMRMRKNDIIGSSHVVSNDK